ncbi:unnamed protein product [Pleuronectes platessa]|uniref:Uncharacterized protein n=1 Tax=Pleuronectes platessa TaxID=8262 RepID=A0A9N7U251_PLEPL|nr:unnamed protein product [Pleuronectes platessa]
MTRWDSIKPPATSHMYVGRSQRSLWVGSGSDFLQCLSGPTWTESRTVPGGEGESGRSLVLADLNTTHPNEDSFKRKENTTDKERL